VVIVQNVEICLPKLFAILPKFSTNQNFKGCAGTHCNPSSYASGNTTVIGLDVSSALIRKSSHLNYYMKIVALKLIFKGNGTTKTFISICYFVNFDGHLNTYCNCVRQYCVISYQSECVKNTNESSCH